MYTLAIRIEIWVLYGKNVTCLGGKIDLRKVGINYGIMEM